MKLTTHSKKCDDAQMEIWRPAKGYEDKYEVSNLGRVRNSKHYIMKPSLREDGYLWIYLVSKTSPNNTSIHRLVAKTSIPNPEGKPQVNHIDGNKTNNRVENLEWVTGSENVRHAYANNLIADKSPEGIRNIVSAARESLKKYCNIPIICETTGQEFESIHHAALHYDVDDTTIQNIVRNVTKRSRKLPGLKFRFKYPEITCRSPHRKKHLIK